ncbi:transglutaminase TgpA family protein [Piscibacillus sp. B03]|uniref:transglutaminase TgpA family protein n=1 Tax=Piscibacillus sp. B03 TaxID=3457430 RepID=UPI003FCD331F
MQIAKNEQWISIVLYAGSMLLLLEWISPLDEVTNTGFTSTFVMYIVLCFILSATLLPFWIVSPIKLIGLLFVLHQLFFEPAFLSRDWFALFWGELQLNLSYLLAMEWVALTSFFRTFLFLILLWMLSYLLYYWFAVRKKPFSFILFTFVYLTVLDTFTTFDASTAIIRAFIIGVAIMGVAYLQHLLEKENMRMPAMRAMVMWIAPLLLVIGFSTIIGYASPKFDPIWPDPVPFIQSTAEGSGFGDGPGVGVQKIGYGENDERLGGGFVQDDTTVFYAQSNKSQYWKVETKDTYTGKGWVRSQDGQFDQTNGSLEVLHTYPEVVNLEEGSAEVQFVEPGLLNKLVYTYGASRVNSANGELGTGVNVVTGEVLSTVNGQDSLPDQYEIDIQRPLFPVNDMKEVTNVDNADMEQYLQLPDDLPDRVVRLAEEITSEHGNRYDQAKAIEDFFSNNGYLYETQDVAVPGQDEDYVDQFLFETQAGYCDNFSTSMVVMLRAVDIPARWVKGFTEGERLMGENLFEGSQPEFEVTNNNAHSWVEVYFPNVGWVPFEPTVGFDNQSTFRYGDTDDDNTSSEEDLELDQPETEMPELDEGAEQEDESGAAAAGWSISKPMKYTLIGGSAVLLGLIIWLLIKKRLRILSKWKGKKLEQSADTDTFTEGYQFLLQALAQKGLMLKQGQTLREFAVDVDRWFGHGNMSQLTAYYERAIYREESIKENHSEVYQLWNRLVNDILA